MIEEKHVLQVFERAIELSPDEVSTFLDEECGKDGSMRDAVAKLLDAFNESQDLLPESQRNPAEEPNEDSNSTVPKFNSMRRMQPGFSLSDRYTIVETIGVGGMGEVYRATDGRLDRDVAIKVVNESALSDEGIRQRFEREIKSVAALSHPNVVTLHDVATHEGIRFAVMELVEGKTLRTLMDGQLDWRDVVGLTRGIAAGLSSAHSRNLIHRDIKPDNVIVSFDGHAKILDFGIARPETGALSQDITAESQLTPGTIPYMSPEQARSEPLTCSTDIFSLGTVMFEALVGKHPFRAQTAFQTMQNVVDASPAFLGQIAAGLPESLISLVEQMLNQNPDLRPTAADIVVSLNQLHQQSTTAAAPTQPATTQDTPAAPSTNLPVAPRQITGRDDEVQAIINCFDSHKIVTLAGPGGVGKTTICQQVAHKLLPDFSGGVWFCEFASVQSSDDVIEVVKAVVESDSGPIASVEEIAHRLSSRPTLLVFDNCEHVIDAVADLTETLTRQVAELSILATSRESLNVAREYVYRVDGLSYSGTGSPAAELFINRASAQTPFKTTPDREHIIEQIVTRLEGLPLAIELAASQLTAMSPEELLEALDDQMSTLRTSRRSQGRQATVEQTIKWSFDLLLSDEQEMLKNLSVFAGPFTGKAAASVCELKTGGRRQLQRLVEQSMLVRSEQNGQSRFRLLEPIRQFCQSVVAPDRLAIAEQRHAHYFVDRANELGRGIYGVDEIRCNEMLDVEWPDLRKAIRWGRENKVIEIAIDPIVAMTRSIMFHLRVEAFQWLAEAVKQFGSAAESRPDVHYAIATGMWVKGDKQQTQWHLDHSKSLGIYPPCLYMQFAQYFSENRFIEALEVIERGRQIAAECNDELEIRWLSLPFAANTLTMVDPTNPRIDESLATAIPKLKSLDWPTGNAYFAMIQGTVAMTRGDIPTAVQRMNQSIEYSVSCGNRALAALVGMILNGFSKASVPPDERLSSTVRDLKLMIEKGIQSGVDKDAVSVYPMAVRSCVIAMADCGHLEEAARCSGLASTLKGSGDQNELSPEYLPTLESLADSLGQATFDRLQAEGAKLSVDDIAALGERLLKEAPVQSGESAEDHRVSSDAGVSVGKAPAKSRLILPDATNQTDTTPLPNSRPTIAVFPLQTLSSDPTHQYFGDAVAQEIIVELSHLRWLPVIARNSSFQFRGPNADLGAAADRLKAKYWLGGSLAVHARQAILSVELCSAAENRVVWAERFNASIDEILQLQFVVTTQMVSAIESSIQRAEANLAIKHPTENLDAWSAYHRGLMHMYRFNANDNAVAAQLFQQAIHDDPHFARAHAGLSFTHFQNAFLKLKDDSIDHRHAARRSAERSAELDPLDPFVNLTLGRVSWLENDLDGAGSWLDQALSLNPSYSFARYNRALVDVMCGDGESGELNAKQAIRLSPIDPLSYAMLCTQAMALIVRGSFEEAVPLVEQAIRQPTAHVHIFAIAAMTNELGGRRPRAQELAKQVRQKSPSYTKQDFFRSFQFRDGEATEVMRQALDRLDF